MKRMTVRQLMLKQDEAFFIEDNETIVDAQIRGDSGRLHVVILKEQYVTVADVTGTDAIVDDTTGTSPTSSRTERPKTRKRNKPQQP